MSISRNKQLLKMRRRRNYHVRRRALLKYLTERRRGASIITLWQHGFTTEEAVEGQRQGLKRRPR